MAWTPTIGIFGTGTGGSVDPVEPPAPASESVAAGGSLAAVTFGAFTDAGGRISSYSATKTNVVGSGTISGSGLGPYTISGTADGEVIAIELDALDSGGDILATAAYTGAIAASGGAAWSAVESTDYTTDITDLTITVGGGDTTLYEADGTTVKATVGAVQRLGTAGVARITAADGGGYIEQAGSTRAVTLYQRLDLSALSVDPSDTSTAILVSVAVSGQTFGQNNDAITVRIGSGSNPNDGGFFGYGIQQLRVSGTSYVRRGIQVIGGTGSVGANQDSQTSARAATVTTFVLLGGRIADVFSTAGSTPDSGVPTVGGTVIKSDQSTTDTIENGATIDQTTDLYVHVEAFTSGGSTSSAVLESVTLSTLTLP